MLRDTCHIHFFLTYDITEWSKLWDICGNYGILQEKSLKYGSYRLIEIDGRRQET